MIIPNNVEITVAQIGSGDKDRVEQLIFQLLGHPIRTDRGSTIGVIEAAFIEGGELKVRGAIDPLLFIKSFTDLMATVSAKIASGIE